jgi:hypothetical protein
VEPGLLRSMVGREVASDGDREGLSDEAEEELNA